MPVLNFLDYHTVKIIVRSYYREIYSNLTFNFYLFETRDTDFKSLKTTIL